MVLSTLSLLSPHTPALLFQTVSKPRSPAWGALDMCLSLLSLCSSYVEVPTYLNFRSMNHMNYFPRNDLVTSRKFVTELIFFNLLFIAVLFHKVSALPPTRPLHAPSTQVSRCAGPPEISRQVYKYADNLWAFKRSFPAACSRRGEVAAVKSISVPVDSGEHS
ncbi:hypothetical protein FKM82_024713 [Ascaphus truei]